MKSSNITIEKLLFIIAVALALGVRLINLGEQPLSDFESEYALKAWHIAQGEDAVIGNQPGYVLTTGALFTLLGSSAFLARFLPALAGSLFLLALYSFRDLIGSKPMLVMAFGLALDPGMVAISRVAGGPMIAISLIFLAIAAWRSFHPVITGILIGLTLLSGPALIKGLFILGISYVLIKWSLGDRVPKLDWSLLDARFTNISPRIVVLISAVIALIIVGTHFFQHPQGLAGIAAIIDGIPIPGYSVTWFGTPQISIGRALVTLATLQPLGLFFALVAVVQSWRKREVFGQALVVWLIVSTTIVVIAPGRQLYDLGWIFIPLWALAGKGLSQYLVRDRENETQSLGHASLIFILLVFIWINLSVLSETFSGTQLYTLRWAIVGIAIAMAVMSSVLVAIGWSTQIARQGLIWGTALALGVYTLAAIWGGGAMDWGGKSPQQAALLMDTVSDMSEWHTGRRENIDVVYQTDAASIEWLLKDYPRARYVEHLSITEMPSMIITVRDDTEPAIGAAYSGQSFIWRVYDEWSGFLPPDWLRWISYRKTAITHYDEVILWAKADLFPEGALIPENGIEVPVEE